MRSSRSSGSFSPFGSGLAVVAVLLGALALSGEAFAVTPEDRGRPLLGQWTADCSTGFRLASMPSAWVVAPGQQVSVATRLAVNYEALPEELYAVSVSPDGERSYELLGYATAFLKAEVRREGTAEPIAILTGVRLSARTNAPAVLAWSGLDRDGNPVPPGFYEIEVRARLLPAWAEDAMKDRGDYADLEGLAEAAEACTRVLRIEVAGNPKDVPPITPNAKTCASPPASYYASVDTSTAANLRATLHAVIDDHVRFPYTSSSTDTWDVLNDADENPANPSTVLDLYKNATFADGCSSGCAWNREHTWAKSFGFQTESGSAATPYTDAHHLRVTDPSYNSSRSNLPHGECTSGCSSYPTVANNGSGGADQPNWGTGGSISCATPTAGQVWETWDHRKGDVARSILYMDIRYEGGTGPLGAEPNLIATDDLSLMYAETTSCGDGYLPVAYHGILSTLLAWHAADPPDADERRRNDQVWCYQQNRNPFVDHPEWVACLYQGSCGGGPATYSISGNAGVAGATVTAGSASATSDASFAYALSGLVAGTYTVTPSKSGCTFSPASQSVTITSGNVAGKNFTATCSGGDVVLTSGVPVTGQSVAYQAWKYYSITVPSGATNLTLATTSASADVDIYTRSGAKPTSSTYTCRPYSSSGNESCSATNPAAGTWWLGVYGYAAATYTVTGTYTLGGTTYSIAGSAGTASATVTAGTKSATSDASGNYTITGLTAGTYTVTPSKSGCTFSPASLSVTVGPNATGKSFTATCGSTPTERLLNGSFESLTASTNTAPDGSWTRSAYSGTSFNTLIAGGSTAHGGTDNAYLGVNNSASQTVDSKATAIPAGATSATLSFWTSIVTSETTTSTAYDKLLVQVVDSSTNTVLATLVTLSNLDKTSSSTTYVQRSYNVTSYKGKSVTVRFKATNDSSYTTTFRVDDVSLKSDG